MQSRRDILLCMVYLLERVWGRTYLQKFIYLLNREVFKETLFDYKFYKYGPFCEDINDEIEELEIEGLLVEKEVATRGPQTGFTYELTETGKNTAQKVFNNEIKPEIRNSLIEYANRFRGFTPTELLRYVYNKYPEVTENSIFGQDD